MKRYEKFCSVFCPNFFVILIAIALGYISIFYIYPETYKSTNKKWFVGFLWIICTVSFFMFLWCWLYAATQDPGRIVDDLEKRGYLNRIHRGDIPLCLSHLPICPHCRVPMPLNSMHCDTCKTCVLRYDHHCGVVGQCIADKNIKAFILSFFYAFLFGESSALTGITFCISDKNSQSFDIMKVLVLIGSLYSGVVGLSLFSFGLATVFHQITAYMSADNDHSSFVRHRKFKFFKMFGNEWWQMLIPIQSTTTYLAWPGIRWNEEYQL